MATLPTPPVAPVTTTGPLSGDESVVLHPFERKTRGESGGAQHHRIERGHSRRHGHHPFCGHPHQFAIAAVVRDAEIPAGDDDLVPGPEAGVGGRHDLARRIDAGIARKAPDDLAGAVVGQRILVVDAGVLGPDDDLARIELGYGHFDKAADDPVVFLKRAIGGELVHAASVERLSRA